MKTPFDRTAHCQRIAAAGGAANAAKHDRWHFVEIGKAGWAGCVAKHGVAYCKGITKRKHWTAPHGTTSFAADMAGY